MLKSEKGVSAVEFALIAPLLFVLTFGIIEFGILLFDKAVVTNASREGARAAIVYNQTVVGNTVTYAPPTIEKISNVVADYTDEYLINLGSTSAPAMDPPVYTPSGIPESGGYVTITVRYSYDFLVIPNLASLLGSGTLDDTIDLVGTTVMRME